MKKFVELIKNCIICTNKQARKETAVIILITTELFLNN